MAALDNLYEALEPLRLYALHTHSLVDRELAVYGKALSGVEELAADLMRQTFVQTATEEDLARHEKLVGLVERQNAQLDARREMVLYRMGVAPQDYTVAGLTASIRTAGMVARLEEHPREESLLVHCQELLDQSVDLDWLKREVAAMLPAHVEFQFDIGVMTWDLFDTGDVSWDHWDATGMTWTEFDIHGHEKLL